MQAVCRVVGELGETDAAGAGTAVRDLDGADEEDFAVMAAVRATRFPRSSARWPPIVLPWVHRVFSNQNSYYRYGIHKIFDGCTARRGD
jgi:hypothetical protein